MTKLRESLFGKKQTAEKSAYTLPARPKYNFVEQYTFVDPKLVLNGGYEQFSECEKIPVFCEDTEMSSLGFKNCVRLPANLVYGFLMELESAPAESIADPKMRTISMVHLSPDFQIVIKANLQNPKEPNFYRVSANSQRRDWVLYVTPEKNRAIVEQLKIHTR